MEHNIHLFEREKIKFSLVGVNLKKKGWGETSITCYIWCMGKEGGGTLKRRWKRRRTNYKIVKKCIRSTKNT